MSNPVFGRTQTAIQTPFTPGRNPDFNGLPGSLTATDAQGAIEEAVFTAVGKGRYAMTAGYAGNAPNSTWLQWFRSNPSNTTPFVIAQASVLREVSLAASVASTCTVTIYKNGAAQTTISLSAATSNYATGLSIVFAAGDKVSARITTGSAQNPGLYIHMQNL